MGMGRLPIPPGAAWDGRPAVEAQSVGRLRLRARYRRRWCDTRTLPSGCLWVPEVDK